MPRHPPRRAPPRHLFATPRHRRLQPPPPPVAAPATSGCRYAGYSPDEWLAEVPGVPFGLPGQILGTNADQAQGLLFGMTCRIYPDPHRCNPRPLWAALDALGMRTAS